MILPVDFIVMRLLMNQAVTNLYGYKLPEIDV
jgi:hypothetical protein